MSTEAPPTSLSAEQLGRLPIFPLKGVHLFPQTLLPLHVFEPRYREMVVHALRRTERAIAIASLLPGFEADYEGRPPVDAVMGAGIILQAHPHEDGRFDLVVRGVQRVRMLSEHPPEHLFREIHAEALEETPVEAEDPRHDRLRSLLSQLAQVAPQAARPIRAMLEQSTGPAMLADLVAAHVMTDAEVCQNMLETLDVGARLDRAGERVGRLLLEVAKGPVSVH